MVDNLSISIFSRLNNQRLGMIPKWISCPFYNEKVNDEGIRAKEKRIFKSNGHS